LDALWPDSGRSVVSHSRGALPKTPGVSDTTTLVLAVFAVVFIGLSKAGFGGGLGILTTPLCVLAFAREGHASSFAIGTVLPLLCAGDMFSLYHYWGKWRRQNLRYLLPGAVIGVIVGVQLVDMFKEKPRVLNMAIGIIAVSFVIFQLVKERIFAAEGAFEPNHAIGVPCGIGMGITSTFAHGAGPVASLFLIPQRMPKEIYVGTTVLVFTWINWIKVPFFAAKGIITWETMKVALWLLPLVPVGVWLGVWLNRRISEAMFLRVVYVFIFITGVQLIANFDVAGWFR
jgi:uncharacterized protein